MCNQSYTQMEELCPPTHPKGPGGSEEAEEKWRTTDRASGEPGPFLFHILESQISRTYLKNKK